MPQNAIAGWLKFCRISSRNAVTAFAVYAAESVVRSTLGISAQTSTPSWSASWYVTLVVLVVGEPDGVRAEFGEQAPVGGVLPVVDRPADAGPVLVHVDPAQRQPLAVERAAVLRVHGEGTQAERLGDGVGEHVGAPVA